MNCFMIECNNLLVRVNSSSDNTTIVNSYRFKSIKDMKKVVALIKAEDSVSSLHKRSLFSVINEWRVHNLLYSLGIEKERTISVDVEAKQPLKLKVLYALGSLLYPHW